MDKSNWIELLKKLEDLKRENSELGFLLKNQLQPESAESFYKTIIDLLPIGIAIFRLHKDKLILVEANQSAEKMLSPEKKGKPIEEIFPLFRDSRTFSKFLETIKTGAGWQTEQIDYKEGSIERALEIIALGGEENKAVVLFQDITEQKKIYEKLLESERRYRAFFEQTNDCIIILEPPSWHFTEANPSAMKLFGIKSKRELGKITPWQISPEFQMNGISSEIKALKMIETAMQNGSHSFEWKHRTFDGKLIDFLILLSRIETGGKVFLQATMRDITELKKMEKALRESQNFLQNVIDTIPLRIFWKDFNLKYLGCNKLFALDAGYNSPEELIGKDDFQMAWREEAELYRRDDEEVIRTGRPKLNYEEPQTTPDGRKIWLRTSKIPLLDSDGNIMGVLGTYEDITDRKLAELKLQESERRYRELFENAIEGIFQSTPEGRFIAVNPSFTRTLGYDSPEELINKVTDIANQVYANPEDRERIKKLLENQNIITEQEIQFKKKDGTPIWVSMSVRALKDSKGNISRYEGYVVDITKRKQLEKESQSLQEQLIQYQKLEAIGRLAGGIAHDFNNALEVILGFTELCMREVDPSSPIFDYLEKIKKAGEQSADLTRQLLAFARKQKILPKVINLNNAIKDMLDMLRRLIGENISIKFLPGNNLWPIYMDPSQVSQILLNLCTNAKDAITGTGTITISTANVTIDKTYADKAVYFRAGDYVLLTVSDDGCGMDSKTLQHIFEPFFTTKEMGRGTGFGLATVYGIVKQNNGFIHVYSEPGYGTTFKIYIPRSFAEESKVEEETTKEPKGGKETILLVEDDPFLLEMAKIALESAGYKVITANSPKQAIDVVTREKEKIDLVITDLIMPEMNGYELIKHLKSIRHGMKYLIISGYGYDILLRKDLIREEIHFIEKPFSIKGFYTKIREILDK